MPGDKNRNILLVFTALIILSAIVVVSLTLNQGSNESGGDSGELDTITPIPTTSTTPSTGNQTSTPLQSQDEVRFTVYVDQSNIKECGWTCREIPATLKNVGERTAHNVKVEVRFYCSGDRIDVNGEEYLLLESGTLGPGESVTRTEKVDVGFGGGLCIQNNGARIVFTVTSDEKTMTLEETYTP